MIHAGRNGELKTALLGGQGSPILQKLHVSTLSCWDTGSFDRQVKPFLRMCLSPGKIQLGMVSFGNYGYCTCNLLWSVTWTKYWAELTTSSIPRMVKNEIHQEAFTSWELRFLVPILRTVGMMLLIWILILYCIVFQYLYSAPQQPWANRCVSGSLISKKRDKF